MQLTFELVSGMVSIGTALAALWFAMRATSFTKRTAAREHESARRWQADRVSVWWDATEDAQPAFVIRNGSEAPVFSITVRGRSAKDERDVGVATARIVRPMTELRLVADFAAGESVVALADVSVAFTDTHGARWFRDGYGRLAHQTESLVVAAGDGVRPLLIAAAKDLQATYGVHVDLGWADVLERESIRELLAGRRPASVVAVNHDWISEFVADGLLDPIALSSAQKDIYTPWALEACTVDERIYALPIQAATTVLLRNRELLPTAPATLDEIIEIVSTRPYSAHGLAVPIGRGDPFHLWPIFSSAGGEMFGWCEERGWNPNDVRIDSESSIGAFERIASLGDEGTEVLRQEMTLQTSRALFARGETPFVISTVGGIEAANAGRIDVVATEVPGFSGGSRALHLGVAVGLAVVRASSSAQLASDFTSDYMTRPQVLRRIGETPGSPLRESYPEPSESPETTAQRYAELTAQARPIPSWQCMSAVWAELSALQLSAIRGVFSPDEARASAHRIRELIEPPRFT